MEALLAALPTLLVRGVGVSVVASLLVLLLRRSAGATRHSITTLTFVALLVLPFVAGPLLSPPVTRSPGALPTIDRHEVPIGARPLLVLPVSEMSISLAEKNQAEESWAEDNRAEPFPLIVPTLFAGVYLLGALLLLSRLIDGWRRVGPLARAATPLDPDHLGHPHVRVSPSIDVPMAVWYGRGIVLLPTTHEGWSPERREAVLRHEAAHLRRGDLLAMFVAGLALALHWPNPLVWRLAAEARRAAEDAADDTVIRSGFAPADYATHLLELARPLQTASRVLALAIARPSDLPRRLQRMLHPRYTLASRRTQGFSTLAAVTSAAVLFGIVGVIGFASGQSRPNTEASWKWWAPDIAYGRSKAATVENGFVGTLADGRRVSVERICRADGGGIECWTPDGELLRDDHARPGIVNWKLPNSRTIVTDIGMTSGPSVYLSSSHRQGGPARLIFDKQILDARNGRQSLYSIVSLSRKDQAKATFELGLSSVTSRETVTVPIRVGVGANRGGVQRPTASFAIDPAVPKKPWVRTNRLFRFSFLSDYRDFRSDVWVTAHGPGKEFHPVRQSSANEGGMLKRIYTFRARPEDVDSVRIESTREFQVELKDLAMNPRR